MDAEHSDDDLVNMIERYRERTEGGIPWIKSARFDRQWTDAEGTLELWVAPTFVTSAPDLSIGYLYLVAVRGPEGEPLGFIVSESLSVLPESWCLCIFRDGAHYNFGADGYDWKDLDTFVSAAVQMGRRWLAGLAVGAPIPSMRWYVNKKPARGEVHVAD